MCQCQLSSASLPSDAATPPCAATVCERVGKTFDNTATLKFASESCSAARKPAPPAPTTTASNCRIAIAISNAPEQVHRPQGACDEPQNRQHIQHEPHAVALDVIHENVAHAYPC